MSARFRIVHFMPDPFAGTRFAVAALVRDQGSRVHVARAPQLPGPACVGGRPFSSLLHMALEDLQGVRSFDALPASVGPHVLLSDEKAVPSSVVDPVAWVESFVLPRRLVAADDQTERTPPA
ncbi:MAG: hypothetical protein L0Y64_27055, partial [Myxococcaceae bacterium]|nr:hypothetical protein [Myxococcaceae bacterium]